VSQTDIPLEKQKKEFNLSITKGRCTLYRRD